MSVAVLYEHPEWLIPLFETLERRGVEYQRVHAAALSWDPTKAPPFVLLINRMSPSAYLRGHGHAIHAAASFIGYLEAHGTAVINGLTAYRLEISKASQLDLFESLGIPYPRSRVINCPEAAVTAAWGLRFPILIKPNIGGSGARIQCFESPDALASAVADGRLDLGIDSTALVQEYLPARGGAIIRIELLDGELLYAIKITPPDGFGFNLCPADICREEQGTAGSSSGRQPDLGLCPTKRAMQIEATSVPPEILRAALAIARRGKLDICGIEYLVDDRDGRAYFYDVNALSNFVTGARQILGFDPFDRFVDYIDLRAARTPLATGPPR